MRKLLALLGVLGSLSGAATAVAGESITPADLAAALQSTPPPRVLDIRSRDEFAAGHVPGAQLIPHDELPSRLGELGAPGELVVYCRSGRRVGLVRDTLTRAGFDVRELEGNYQGWQAADLPVAQPASGAQP